MRCKRIMDQLLHELGIITVPGIEEEQLPVGIVRLDGLYAGELRCGVPDKFMGHGDLGRLLPFAQHELEATVPRCEQTSAGLRRDFATACLVARSAAVYYWAGYVTMRACVQKRTALAPARFG